jgi:hypothetical protein
MEILKNILILCAVVAAIVFAFAFGKHLGVQDATEMHTKLRIKENSDLQQQLLQLDQSFLANLVTRPGTLISGTYKLDVQYAGQATNSFPVTATFANGRLVGLTMAAFRIEKLAQSDSFVSWEQHHFDGDQGPSSSFIGLVDGNQMSGKVYLHPGNGWHEGEPAACGVWNLRSPGVLSTNSTLTN